MKDNIIQRCNQKCRDRARDKNKPRRSSATTQQAQQMSTALELKLDSLLKGQQQLLQAMNGLSFPAMQRVRHNTVFVYSLFVIQNLIIIAPLFIYSMM